MGNLCNTELNADAAFYTTLIYSCLQKQTILG